MLYATCSMRIPQYSISAWIFTACSQKHTCDEKQRCQYPQLFCQACKHCGALQVAQYMWIIFFSRTPGDILRVHITLTNMTIWILIKSKQTYILYITFMPILQTVKNRKAV